MARTLTELQTSLAYRLDEDSVPNSNTAEYLKRIMYLNEAYRDIMRRHTWWFAESTGQFSTIAGQESYGASDGVPSDIRSILELRFQGKLYSPITQSEGMGAMTTPYSNFSEAYFMFGGKIYFVPKIGSSVTNGVTIKYYKTATDLSSGTDTVIIPDMFADALVCYASARCSGKEGEKGSAGDGFAEYTEILKIMTEEQNKYLFQFKSSSNELVGEYT